MAIVTMPSVEKSPGGTSWTAPMTSPVVKSSSGLCLSPPLSPNSESDVAAQQDLVGFLVQLLDSKYFHPFSSEHLPKKISSPNFHALFCREYVMKRLTPSK